jgi:hypothetical protein
MSHTRRHSDQVTILNAIMSQKHQIKRFLPSRSAYKLSRSASNKIHFVFNHNAQSFTFMTMALFTKHVKILPETCFSAQVNRGIVDSPLPTSRLQISAQILILSF